MKAKGEVSSKVGIQIGQIVMKMANNKLLLFISWAKF